MPSPSPARIRIPIDAQDPAAWTMASGLSDALAKQDENVREVILLTHTKRQLSSTSLGNFVGKAAAKALLANNTLPPALLWQAVAPCYPADDRRVRARCDHHRLLCRGSNAREGR